MQFEIKFYALSEMPRYRGYKKRCIKLYLEGIGFRGIKCLSGVSNITVRRWVKKRGDDIERLRPQAGEID
ncbi:hypothetical protein Noc_1540 [Nitrosococcus oceani ATCC 19707]|uniref:Transposase n=2 Tax=Nitrosococcus oceani TaxID=1229 RepID=Q3JAX2_NITOC|nr:hypothetical protein Noc_1540 [Nitrosococcus oceani ATCC 19707]KFI19547.1 hypothetical protein IB75_08095 [Nitrosococcus oceani C-27]GEM21017.1 hypothetical protein NONS58_24450 [Nitrosococcus oceani]